MARARTRTETKTTDAKGRITLGGGFANATLLVEHRQDGTVVIQRAVTVPVQDEWLFKNKAAFERVKRGLKQAQERDFAEGPALPPLED
jgi:acyl-CoA thioesterase